MTYLLYAVVAAVGLVVLIFAYLLYASGGDPMGLANHIEDTVKRYERLGTEIERMHTDDPCPGGSRGTCEQCAPKHAERKGITADVMRTMPGLVAIGAVIYYARWFVTGRRPS